MSLDKEYLKLTTVLFRAMQNVEIVIKNDISSYQLNTSEFGVLELLFNRGKQPIQSIANRLLMANSSMTYVIDKLESKNMISRTTDDVDRRITMVDLTEEGHKFFSSIFPNHVHTLGEIYQCLSKDELMNLIESLKKIGYKAMDMNGEKK